MDLLSSRPFWPIRDGLPTTFPPLERDATCDVAIIGAGVSGAMVAHALVSAGRSVIVLDRREAAHGSTAGNTGLLLYELDRPMHWLARRFGAHVAKRVYLRCRDAVLATQRMVHDAGVACELTRKRSMYVAASRAHVDWLKREFELRREAGIKVEWWSRARIAAESSLPHAAAIVSDEAAQLDVYQLTYGLLAAVRARGVQVHDRTEVTRTTETPRGVRLRTSRGCEVRARHLVVATGYEAEKFLPTGVGALRSTFAAASEPIDGWSGWPADGAMIWDTGDPYLYLRTTADRRAIIGGYDELFRDPRARDRMLTGKASALQRRFRQLFPRIPFEIATAWAGTFGVSNDGLPFIGQQSGMPHTWFALGFGGNGTTFSRIASEIICAGILGQRDPDAELFGFERKLLAQRRAN